MVIKLVELSKKNKIIGFFIELACYLFFAIVDIWNRVMGLLRTIGVGGKTYSSLKKYRNIHQGERCFIIATGPSLTMEDLESLQKEYTFGMNSIVNKFNETNFRPTYYGIQDHIVYEELKDYILKYYSNSDNVFVSDRIKWHSIIGKKWNVFPLNMSYHAYKRWFRNEYFSKFSDDIYKTVYNGFSITYSLIEIASYMGFKKIYLIGADCSYTKGKKHFAEYKNHDTTLDTAKERLVAGYKVAKEFADENNFTIYNATRGGELEIFERVDLDKIMNRNK